MCSNNISFVIIIIERNTVDSSYITKSYFSRLKKTNLTLKLKDSILDSIILYYLLLYS